MKNIIIAILLAVTLLGCESAQKYSMSLYQAKTAYERVHERHDILVSEFSKYKNSFSAEERVMLREALLDIEEVKARVKSIKATADTAEKALILSEVLKHYDSAKIAYTRLVLILEPHFVKMPLSLRIEAQQQIIDAKKLDSAVQILLDEDGDGVVALEKVLKLLGVVAKIAMAAA